MKNEPTAEELTRALTGLMDAHRKYDREFDRARSNGEYSWDYGGHYADDVKKAHENLDGVLTGYIDSQVRAVLEGMGIHEHFARKMLVTG